MRQVDQLDSEISNQRARRVARDTSLQLRRRIQNTLYTDLADICLERGVKEPGGFLADLMTGLDPRPGQSRIAQIVQGIRARGIGSQPSEPEWAELADLIEASPLVRGETVPVEMSARAAEKLLPYLYAQRKDDLDNGAAVVVSDPCPALTKKDIELFRQYWIDEYC